VSAHAPSPLGDTSYLHYFSDRAQGISNTRFEFGTSMIPGLPQDVLAPSAWFAVALTLSAALLVRRSVP
jgi:hypothetical protein